MMIDFDSNKVYETLFNTATEGLVVVDKFGKIVLTNPRICELFGYKKDELIGQLIEVLMPAGKRSTHVHQRNGFMQNPQSRRMGGNLNLKAERKDSSSFYVEISLNHLKIEDQEYVMALISDISDRVKAQYELKHMNDNLEQKVTERTIELENSQKLYRLIASNFPNGSINVLDRNFNYVFSDGQELRKLGQISTDLIGRRYLDKFDKSAAGVLHTKLKSVFKGFGMSYEFDLNEDTYVINAVPLSNAASQIEQILIIEKNITDKKQLEEHLLEMLNKEKNLNELKSRFVSMASHEFRTPLSTILSSTTLAERYYEKGELEKSIKHFGRIKSSVRNLTSILNDFLSLDKLEEGRLSLNISEFSFHEVMQDVIEDMEANIKAGQSINYVNAVRDVRMNSDMNLIKNILLNLISNASKYSDESKSITIEVTVIEDNILCFTVSDQGIGIPKKEQSQLFQRFFRGGNVTNIEGTGLGLNIVTKYLELLDGSISFESEEEKGTTFKVEISKNIV